jgi:hypothetical protein
MFNLLYVFLVNVREIKMNFCGFLIQMPENRKFYAVNIEQQVRNK